MSYDFKTQRERATGDIEAYLHQRYGAGVAAREGAKSLPRMLLKTLLTKVQVPVATRRAKQLSTSGSPLRLHLGCGDTYIEDWINIDLARPGRKQDLDWDLRHGLPFPDSSVEAIFSEHTLEHLALDAALVLFKECAQTLRPGGIMRISVPDLEYHVRQYSISSDQPQSGAVRLLTPALILNELFYFHGHRTMYDYPMFDLLLTHSGFQSVRRSSFGGGALPSNLDSPGRREQSLYIEAVR